MKPVHRHAQRGAVLIVALLFLTILTILGVTAMTATTFEERMAGNTRDVSLAFQAAEAALRDARRDLNGIVIGGLIGDPPARVPRISGKTGFGDGTDANNSTCGKSKAAVPQTLGLCRSAAYDAGKGIQPVVNNSTTIWQDPPAGNDSSVEYGTYTGAVIPPTLFSRRPRYFIEVLCYLSPGGTIGALPMEACAFYRITARGYGGNPNTQVTVQEIFLRP